MNKNVVIGGAWPYANNSLHLGHISGILSGDILARYHRMKGDNVAFVSGSDCHGTPITERAKKEGRPASEIALHYDAEDRETFKQLGFSYDLYTNTDTDYHKKEVQEIFKKIYDNGYIYEKEEPQAFCTKCNKFLADREVQITCKKCGTVTKGDQCDGCQNVPLAEELIGGVCLTCGTTTVESNNKNLYFALSKFQKDIEEHTKNANEKWRLNAKNETDKYLKQGLKDRAVTRDLDWGVDIPLEGFDDKKLYVWIEAVLGYITATKKWCEDNNKNWEEFWKNGNDNLIYMAHGKDNIVFHSIIFNALLLALKDDYHLVDMIVSSEHLTIDGEKISKSKGNGTPVIELLKEYNADSLRFYSISNGPEKKDANFTFEGLKNSHNSELVNKFGNLVNRTMKFKGLEEIPEGKLDEEIKQKIMETYTKVGELIENIEFREAISEIINLVEIANKYYDERKPWVQKKEDIEGFNDTIFTCTTIIANLSNLFEPFIPFSCEKLRKYFDIEKPTWEYRDITAGIKVESVEPLFGRM